MNGHNWLPVLSLSLTWSKKKVNSRCGCVCKMAMQGTKWRSIYSMDAIRPAKVVLVKMTLYFKIKRLTQSLRWLGIRKAGLQSSLVWGSKFLTTTTWMFLNIVVLYVRKLLQHKGLPLGFEARHNQYVKQYVLSPVTSSIILHCEHWPSYFRFQVSQRSKKVKGEIQEQHWLCSFCLFSVCILF